VRERTYPTPGWGSRDVPPSTDELIYAHPRGFALHSLRLIGRRLYIQVDPDEEIATGPTSGLAALQRRLGLPGWTCTEGPVGEGHHPDAQLRRRADAARAAVPGRRRRAHRAAHRAKGLTGRADVTVLARALIGGCATASRRWPRLLRDLHRAGLAGDLLLLVDDLDAAHPARPGPFDQRLQWPSYAMCTSRAAATALAENYTGAPLPDSTRHDAALDTTGWSPSDVHVHVEIDDDGRTCSARTSGRLGRLLQGGQRTPRRGDPEYYGGARWRGRLHVDAEAATGHPRSPTSSSRGGRRTRTC